MISYLNLFPAGNPAAAFDGGFAFNALSFNTPSDSEQHLYGSV
jgi:hypothetical protein